MIRELTVAVAIAGAAIAMAPSATADPGPMYPDDPGRYTDATDVPGMNYEASLGAPCDNYQLFTYGRSRGGSTLVCHYIPNQWPPVYTGFLGVVLPDPGRQGDRVTVPESEGGGAGAGRPTDGLPRCAGLAAGHADRCGLLPRLIDDRKTIRTAAPLYVRDSWVVVTHFNLSDVFGTVADGDPRRDVPGVAGPQAQSYGDVEPTGGRLRQLSDVDGPGLPHRARRAGRPRVRPGPPRHLPSQRQRVPRGDDRVVPGPRRTVQHELPLRRGRVAVPAHRLAGQGAGVPGRVRTAGGGDPRSPATPAGARSRSPTNPATRCSPGAVDYETILSTPSPADGHARCRAVTISTSSTPAGPRECPRACCGVSTTSSCRRWAAARGEATPRWARSPNWPRRRAPRRARCR